MTFMSNRVTRIVTIHYPIKNVSIVRGKIIEAALKKKKTSTLR